MNLNELSLKELATELPLLSFPKRLLVIAAVWLTLLMIGYFLFWKHDLETSQRLEMSIQESLGRLNLQSQLLLEAPTIEAQLAQLELQLPLLKMALPTERELASLLERINELILDQKLKLIDFTPGEPINQEVMRIVPVKVSVHGEGDAISRLPNQIASLSRQVSLKEFEMALVPESRTWKMTGALNAYAQLPTMTPQSEPKTLQEASPQ